LSALLAEQYPPTAHGSAVTVALRVAVAEPDGESTRVREGVIWGLAEAVSVGVGEGERTAEVVSGTVLLKLSDSVRLELHCVLAE
jgi:hypothetical protein